MTLVIDGAHVVTVTGAEHAGGHVVVEGNRITAVGAGPAPRIAGARLVDGRGCLLTPGIVNTHQHLYQWVTRGLAVDATLFEWLTTLYPVWARLDEHAVHVAASGALGWLARTGCTTSTDHHYVFPSGGGDLLAAEIAAAQAVGLRFHPCRGSMDLGRSAGGLPPDRVHDRLVARAPAQVPGQRLPDLRVRRTGAAVEQVVGGDDQPRGAEAALHGAALEERLLHRVEILLRREPLHGGDLAPLRLSGGDEARTRRHAVEVHGAGSAFALLAGVLRAGQAHPLAQHVEQALAGPDVVDLVADAVDGGGDAHGVQAAFR